LAGPSLAKSPPPPVALLYVLGVWGALTAGFTLNGLFAFGEEYGWRGWLMDQLEPLGAVRANLLTGVMWGVWHAPLILMGFNYGRAGALGVVAMVVMCTPFSFLLWRARRASGSVLSAAVIHGGFNGMAGFLLLFDAGRAPLVGVPTGAVGALALGLVAAAMWPLSARWAARPIGDLVDAAPAAQVAAAAPTSAAEQAS
jgi:membrane protease YdiL (CAAX protease family)